MVPGVVGIIHGTWDWTDPAPDDINHGTGGACNCGSCIHGQFGYAEVDTIAVCSSHIFEYTIASADAAFAPGGPIV
jgi:hypothetical protein